MPEVNYKVDLFYGDVGFTSDYANVLQFDSANARDSYFDNISEKDTFDNTDFNNIQLSGNTIKLAFVDATKLARLEKYNYLRILTRLYGGYESASKYDYGFIVDYTIISSSSNVTIVEFTFETDLWQNFQFDFELKECSVERSHMDRWDSNGNIIYNTPSYDAIDSYMTEKSCQELSNEKTFYISDGETASTTDTSDLALCIISYLFPGTESGINPDTGVNKECLSFIYFFVDTQNINRHIPYINANEMNGTALNPFQPFTMPSLAEVINGTYISYLGLDGNRVKNVTVLYDANINVKREYGTFEVKVGNVTLTFSGYINKLADGSNVVLTKPRYHIFEFVQDLPKTTYVSYMTDGSNDNPWHLDRRNYVAISKPTKPTDDDDYSPNYEVMLYKSPVVNRYITSFDGSVFNQIPDTVIDFKGLNQIKLSSIISYASMYNIVRINEDELATANIIADSYISQGIDADILSNAWESYVMTTRDSDRRAMWLNIATGGIADSGSTMISAGIGYRSNAERSFMYNTLGTGTHQDKAMAGMFDRYAKQAAAMSIAGGVLQYGSNAINKYFGQEIKEQAIKNTPGTLTKTGDIAGIAYRKPKSNIKIVETVCDDVAYEKYKNIFKKFGYAVYSVIKPNIKSRKYFNYIKTNGAILTGSLNQSVLAKLCRIFDNGVTIWHMDYTTKATLYNYDKENIERSLIGE